MEYTKNIRIFRLINNINLPLAENPNEIVECNIGNLIICYDGNNVFAQDWGISNLGTNMSLLAINLKFIEINNEIFEELT